MKQTTMKRKGFMTALALCALVAGIAAAAPWNRDRDCGMRISDCGLKPSF